MFSYVERKLGEVFDSILEPVLERLLAFLRGLHWKGRIVVILVCLGTLILVTQRDLVADWGTDAGRMLRAWQSPPGRIPLGADLTAQLLETRSRIAQSLRGDLDSPGQSDPSPWPVAQAIVAAEGVIDLDAAELESYFRKVAESSCACWREIPDPTHPRNVPATAWIIFALAHLGVAAKPGELQFLLAEQDASGWWSFFPVNHESEFASAYSTAWTILALDAQLSRKFVASAQEKELRSAIARGAAWLAGNRDGERSRWKDYPLNPKGQISISISGLVLHALNVTARDTVPLLNRDWMRDIDLDVPTADGAEHDYYWIRSRDGYVNENFVQIKLPWQVIATTDAYESGTLRQRARALHWIERALGQKSAQNADTEAQNWWRSELLIAVRYVLLHVDEAIQNPAKPAHNK